MQDASNIPQMGIAPRLAALTCEIGDVEMSYVEPRNKVRWYCENCGCEVLDVDGEEWHFVRGGHGAGVCGECYKKFAEMNPDLDPDEYPFW